MRNLAPSLTNLRTFNLQRLNVIKYLNRSKKRLPPDQETHEDLKFDELDFLESVFYSGLGFFVQLLIIIKQEIPD